MCNFHRFKNIGLLFVFLLSLVLSQSACGSRDLYVCASGQEKCDKDCVNLNESREHCGACGKACGHSEECESGVCKPSEECKSGDVKECYGGAKGTEGVGLCKAGSQACGKSEKWGGCLREVRPSSEVCNGKDDDCDGKTDEGSLCGVGTVCERGKCAVPKCIADGSCVSIKAGRFIMGSPKNEKGRFVDEVLHSVSISYPYLMMKYEVTQGEFQALMGYRPSKFKVCGSRCPVEGAHWHEAAKFANAKSKKEGLEECFSCSGLKEKTRCKKAAKRVTGYLKCKGWRLPSEAEWEYAYRAGTKTAFYNGDIKLLGGKDPNADKIAWFGENSRSKMHEVGKKAPNGWGLYDMGGNVSEWVFDGYEKYGGDVIDPLHDARAVCVTRGGYWLSKAEDVRGAARYGASSTTRYVSQGFRLSRSLSGK